MRRSSQEMSRSVRLGARARRGSGCRCRVVRDPARPRRAAASRSTRAARRRSSIPNRASGGEVAGEGQPQVEQPAVVGGGVVGGEQLGEQLVAARRDAVHLAGPPAPAASGAGAPGAEGGQLGAERAGRPDAGGDVVGLDRFHGARRSRAGPGPGRASRTTRSRTARARRSAASSARSRAGRTP